MTPTPPSPEDDILDLLGLDLKPEKPKAQTPESDFEKELEALFAEDLTEPEIKAPAPDASAAFGTGEDALLLEDPAPAPDASAAEDVLDLSEFSAPASSPAQDDEVLDLGAFVEPDAPQDDEVLDLGVFSAGGELDITPPEDTPGGKDGGIDTAALDDLISGLGETRKPQAPPSESPLDETDMSDLLETLNVPPAVGSAASAASAAPLSQPADEMLELSMDDLVEGMPAMEVQAAPAPEAPAAEMPELDISLPDFSEPEPQDLATQDMGGDFDLPLAEAGLGSSVPDAAAEQLLDTSDLDISGLMEGGMMEGLEAPAEEAAAEQSLDPAALLDQIPDGLDASEAAPGSASAGGLLDGLSLGGAALGGAAAGAALAGGLALGARSAAQAPPAAEIPAREAQPGLGPMPAAALHELQEKLAALATQVTGGSVALVRLEGQLAEKDQALAALEQRLHVSWDESHSLRRELSDLRSQLEETLRQRAQADEKAAMEIKERLALVEDRQIQIDRDVRTEIERAVPREAARVIREEIAALASSMHDE